MDKALPAYLFPWEVKGHTMGAVQAHEVEFRATSRWDESSYEGL
jgi:surfactin synthase thioesterase subunit